MMGVIADERVWAEHGAGVRAAAERPAGGAAGSEAREQQCPRPADAHLGPLSPLVPRHLPLLATLALHPATATPTATPAPNPPTDNPAVTPSPTLAPGSTT